MILQISARSWFTWMMIISSYLGGSADVCSFRGPRVLAFFSRIFLTWSPPSPREESNTGSMEVSKKILVEICWTSKSGGRIWRIFLFLLILKDDTEKRTDKKKTWDSFWWDFIMLHPRKPTCPLIAMLVGRVPSFWNGPFFRIRVSWFYSGSTMFAPCRYHG